MANAVSKAPPTARVAVALTPPPFPCRACDDTPSSGSGASAAWTCLITRPCPELSQHRLETRSQLLQLDSMRAGEAQKQAFAAGRQAELDAATVLRRNVADRESLLYQAIHEPDRAVMADVKLRRKIAYCGGLVRGHPLDGQERLILAGREADVRGRLLAEAQELPQSITEGREGPVLAQGKAVWLAQILALLPAADSGLAAKDIIPNGF